MDRWALLAELHRQNISIREIADALHVSRTTVSRVCHRQVRSRRIAEAIAARLERPMTDIWDDFYPERRSRS